ncbi:MAG: Adaptive-response sensory-kinase SasA [Phycisphaerae bacterium]|nr:Adaptive-response sensory-kinase SasA [Phycisphaerae bacterium]
MHAAAANLDESIARRQACLLRERLGELRARADRLFAGLLLLQWLCGVGVALALSPYAWSGATRAVHLHVHLATWLGGVLTVVPLILVLEAPGGVLTRHVIAISQMLFSALFIHLSGGRIETHFHVFGSLAFLGFYRDWRVLIPATLVVAFDHALRGAWWPESVFGQAGAGLARVLEHTAWVAFEDTFLIYSCVVGVRDMRELAHKQATLEAEKLRVEDTVTERTAALKAGMAEREALLTQLTQAQKLESIGRLAAGIAHEINTPTQFINDNVRFLKETCLSLLEIVDRVADELKGTPAQAEPSPRAAELRAALQVLDYEFARREIPKAIEQSLEGLAHVTRIVRAMKDYSHPARDELNSADLNRAIESTVTVARNEWKYVADLVLDLDPALPPVQVSLGEFNQVILNLVVNAAHAIEDAVGRESGRKGTITISTRAASEHAEIRVADTGCGIPPQHRERIFEHFFTTKGVGRGTGQGLAVARAVIVEKHRGSLTFETQVGQGTTFILRLPCKQPEPQEAAS